MSAAALARGPRWWVPGDLDGFLGLALDNLIQILLIISLCRGVLGYPNGLIFGVILPATGISLVVGNFAYAWQAYRLAQRLRRDDLTALPYGINTVSLFAYVFLVMLPVKLAALGLGQPPEIAVRLSWQAGLVACLGSGLIEAVGGLGVGWLRRWLPRAALLSTLAGIALSYIALGFLLRTYAQPVVGLAVLAVILVAYYGQLRLPLPAGLLAQSNATDAAVEGWVKDATGAGVPNARLVVRNVSTNEDNTTTSNGDGYYRFPLLKIGEYELAANAAGFKEFRRTNVTLTVGQKVRLDLERGRLSLQLRAGSTVADETLRTLMRDAGFVVRQIRRSPIAP